MKLLTVPTLLCTMVALGTAAGEGHVWKRAASCPSGWTQYGNRCFLYNRHQMTWAQAQRFCEFMSANLPCVHSNKEYQFIQGLISSVTHASGETWIGGSDAQEDNYWFCLDGTRFTYAEWCQGEPNNYDRNEHCLLVNYSERNCWNDGTCYTKLPFVCVRTI